jgi:hypothetical protein
VVRRGYCDSATATDVCAARNAGSEREPSGNILPVGPTPFDDDRLAVGIANASGTGSRVSGMTSLTGVGADAWVRTSLALGRVKGHAILLVECTPLAGLRALCDLLAGVSFYCHGVLAYLLESRAVAGIILRRPPADFLLNSLLTISWIGVIAEPLRRRSIAVRFESLKEISHGLRALTTTVVLQTHD